MTSRYATVIPLQRRLRSGGLLGQTAGRTSKTVVEWLDARGEAWKAQVKVVVIDMCSPYRHARTLDGSPSASATSTTNVAEYGSTAPRNHAGTSVPSG